MNTKELTERCVVLEWSSVWESDLYAFVRHWIDASDSVEVHTSGSTGLPKIIKHTKTAMRESAARTCDFLGLRPGMSALLCMSTRNIAGMMMVVRTFERDLNLLPVAPDGHPLKGIPAGTSIDFCAMVPAQVYNSLQVPEERLLLESIRHLIIGGAPVSYALLQQLRELPGNVWATFGMTETISHIALRKLNGKDASDEYTLLEGVGMEVGVVGNLIIHAPYLSPDPIITNDVVEITGKRTFRWLGRQDHVINSGGFKIFPELVEEKISGVMSRLSGTFAGDGWIAGDKVHAGHAGDGVVAGDKVHVGHAGDGEVAGDKVHAGNAGDGGDTGMATQRYFIGSIPDEKLGEVPVLVIEMPTPDDKGQRADSRTDSLHGSLPGSFHDSLFGTLAGILPRHELPREILFVEKFIETPTGKIIRSATLKKLIR